MFYRLTARAGLSQPELIVELAVELAVELMNNDVMMLL